MQLILQLVDIWDKAGLVTSTITPYRCCCLLQRLSQHCETFLIYSGGSYFVFDILLPSLLIVLHHNRPLLPVDPCTAESLPPSPPQVSSKSFPTVFLSKSSPRSAASIRPAFHRTCCSSQLCAGTLTQRHRYSTFLSRPMVLSAGDVQGMLHRA
jgi:hypothetical protein